LRGISGSSSLLSLLLSLLLLSLLLSLPLLLLEEELADECRRFELEEEEAAFLLDAAGFFCVAAGTAPAAAAGPAAVFFATIGATPGLEGAAAVVTEEAWLVELGVPCTRLDTVAAAAAAGMGTTRGEDAEAAAGAVDADVAGLETAAGEEDEDEDGGARRAIEAGAAPTGLGNGRADKAPDPNEPAAPPVAAVAGRTADSPISNGDDFVVALSPLRPKARIAPTPCCVCCCCRGAIGRTDDVEEVALLLLLVTSGTGGRTTPVRCSLAKRLLPVSTLGATFFRGASSAKNPAGKGAVAEELDRGAEGAAAGTLFGTAPEGGTAAESCTEDFCSDAIGVGARGLAVSATGLLAADAIGTGAFASVVIVSDFAAIAAAGNAAGLFGIAGAAPVDPNSAASICCIV
jgi:hypothetical protein